MVRLQESGYCAGVTPIEGVITQSPVVPAPSTVLLLAAGLVGLVALPRRRRAM
ncbi:MAG: PEP-CTERM sorting domain-containing protein [Gemmatimonadaceae bacterium]|jgi:hypothetical protein|nr:PEP-CTERM sorting domain-containing protein [Gemmatimonadaceae bacterium]